MSERDFSSFPVGTRVKVKRGIVDFHGFSGKDRGIVVKNSGTYLGIIVEFDQPRWIQPAHGSPYEMKKFNFNPEHLKKSRKKNG